MTPRLEHTSQLEVFARLIPEALHADAEDVVKFFRAKMRSHFGALKCSASASASKTPTKKPKSGDGDTLAASLFD